MPEDYISTWDDVDAELASARQWRRKGNEGRARVCARRAAGWAALLHKQRDGLAVKGENAYKALLWLMQAETMDARVREAAGRLSAQVTDGFDYPFREDALEDAQMIILSLRD